MWASLTLPKQPWSCSNGHPALATLGAQLEGHPGVQSLDPLGTFSPHLSLPGAAAKSGSYRAAPPSTRCTWDTSSLQPCQSVDVLDCPEKPCVCFVHIWSYSEWVNKVLSALPKQHRVKDTTLLKNLPSRIPKTDHSPCLSRVWLVFICAIKLLHLWLHSKTHYEIYPQQWYKKAVF